MGAAREGGILLVCAANVCRSPLAELTLRSRFAQLPGLAEVHLESAGISVREPRPVCPDVEAFDEGGPWRELAAEHRSRALAAADVLRAGLVLTASRSVRSTVVVAAPAHRGRVFTLREAVWLARGYVGESGLGGRAAIEALHTHLDSMRGLRPVPESTRQLPWQRRPRHPLDIRDGHNLGAAAHQETLRAVFESAHELAELIAAPQPPRR